MPNDGKRNCKARERTCWTGCDRDNDNNTTTTASKQAARRASSSSCRRDRDDARGWAEYAGWWARRCLRGRVRAVVAQQLEKKMAVVCVFKSRRSLYTEMLSQGRRIGDRMASRVANEGEWCAARKRLGWTTQRLRSGKANW